MDITIIVLVVVTCLMLGLAVFYHVKSSGTEKVMRERIEGKVAPNTDRYTYLKQFMSKSLSSLGNANAPTNTAEAAKLKKDLQAAGYRTEKAPILFAGSKVLFMASLPMALFLVHPNWTKTAPATTLMACYVVLAGIGSILLDVRLEAIAPHRLAVGRQPAGEVRFIVVLDVHVGGRAKLAI